MSHRNIKMPVEIFVRYGGDTYDLGVGAVEPPKVNGIPIYTADKEFEGKRSPDGKPVSVYDALKDLWVEWHEEIGKPLVTPPGELPLRHVEFVVWLVKKKGWTYFDDTRHIVHVFDA